jgi:acetyl esterase
MLQALKVWVLRQYYRRMSARGWRDYPQTTDHSLLQIPGPQGQLAVRMYQGEQSADQPLLIYFHGGGWVIGDLDTHHPFCQALCAHTGSTVLSVDYRLAPEHPFPAAHEDCLAATQWVIGHLADLPPSNGTVVVAGDSAGGNLAVATALQLQEQGESALAGVLSIYPVADHYRSGYPSYDDKGKGFTLTKNLMVWFWDTYLQRAGLDWRAAPLRAQGLGNLPPTLLITAEHDPLRDEGIALGKAIKQAGGRLTYRHVPNAQHGFACSEGETDDFLQLMREIKQWLP